MIFGQFALMVLTAGVFFAIINNWQEWSWQVVNGMSGIANELGFDSTSADAPFETACKLVGNYWKKLSITDLLNSLALCLGTLIMLICLALVAAQVLFVKCEAMIAMTASMVLLGLAGASMFKDYAVNTCRYALAVAFKLFVVYLLLGVGMSFISSLTVGEDVKFTDMLTTVAACVVLLVLVKQLPDACAGIIQGSHVTSSNALGSAVMAGVSAGAAVATGGASLAAKAAGGLANVKAAASLAGAQGQGGLMGAAKTLGSAYMRARDTGQTVRSVLRSQTEAQRQNENL